MIAEEIKKAYEKSDLSKDKRFAEVFSILTAPVHRSFINEAEVSLFRVAQAIEKEKLKDVFRHKDPKYILNELKGKRALQLLQEHQQNFFWIKNNYVSTFIITLEELVIEIKKLFDLGIDLQKDAEKIEHTPVINKQDKEDMMKSIKLGKELKILIKISEDFTYWQDERKKSTMWNMHYFSSILKELSRRVGLDIEDMKYMTCREVSIIFEHAPTAAELQARRKNGVYYWDEEGIDALHSKEADEVRQKVLGSQDMSDVDDFRGLTACTGKAVGHVKILKSATEINKIEPGDILVAVMTRPDYVPAMKKAAAIVTDEGGITSHAAIVSRELGIPCIIGTKIATKVLKEGQLVEVNANHGWVKIIR
ncbi:MAG: hypothetical protein KKE20_06490 [Nanoarchaeota archaeon]|nr:hypothetical protein [Nanoarchaeota archaeon]